MSSFCAAASYTPATWYQVFSERVVALYRCVVVLPVPETPTANVWGPVSGLVLNSQPRVPELVPAFEMICPPSAGVPVAKTHALHVMLPVIRSGTGFPRLTKLLVPL